MSGQGFASLSEQKRIEMAQKGGKASHVKGKRHKWTKSGASLAGKKSAEVKRYNKAQVAAKRLLKEFKFDPIQLNGLGLTLDEFIYYGGPKSNPERRVELKARLVRFDTPHEHLI